MFVCGWINDLLTFSSRKSAPGYAPLVADFEDFYIRNLYRRVEDCFNRPIASAPDAHFEVCARKWEGSDVGLRLECTGKNIECVNLSSYNYLGFAAQDEYCTPRCLQALDDFGWSTCSPILEGGYSPVHEEAERLVARYVGHEAALIFGMGFATNTATIPLLVGKGDLVISDALNHKSIVSGVRLSGAKVKVFQHNDARNLEKVLRAAIAQGQPRTGRPWKRVWIMVEGIYSMEGDMTPLREIVALKKKYRAYLYLDEAHSIGALGPTGRGLCEHVGVDPRDVEVMMGTFTKSFGSCGGYICGSQELVEHLRRGSPSSAYATSMAPPALGQVVASLKVVMGEDGTSRGRDKIQQIKDNSNWFRQQLDRMGLDVLGVDDSPIIPIMCYSPAKAAAVSRMALQRGLALVMVGFPATSLVLARVRVCISAAHSRKDLEFAISVLKEVVRPAMIRYNQPSLLRHQLG
jgi:serine palmitoyltransferase